MGKYYLGLPFDIHGGGQDLTFPHHENEIAQSVAAYEVDVPVKYWMHNGFLTIDSEKMAKSEGNFFTAREVLDNYDHQAVRLYLVSGHYRQPLDYNATVITQAIQTVERIRNAVDTLRGRVLILERSGGRVTEADGKMRDAITKLREGFEKEMDDDFNTPGALAEIFTFIKASNSYTPEVGNAAVLREALAAMIELVGIIGIDLESAGVTEDSGESSEKLKGTIELLLEIRENARTAKDWTTADLIRNKLGELGIEVADTKDGPTWKMS